MENAQLINLSRQIGLQRQMDVLANNLANINTTGFKAEQILFEEFEMPVARDRDFSLSDQPLAFTQDWATIHDMAPGALVQTGGELDVGLSGEGFFAVDTPEGERWTRAGSFQLDAVGTLVTVDGHPVLSDSGTIRFEPGETGIMISATGEVSTAAGSKGSLRIVEFDNPHALVREGDNLFSGGEAQPAVATRTVQGAIERSNVSGVAAMTEMIRVTRSYESLARLMQQQDDMRRDAIQTLGNLNA